MSRGPEVTGLRRFARDTNSFERYASGVGKQTPRGSVQALWYFAIGLVVIAAGVAAVVVVRTYRSTGEWKLPTAQSMVQIKEQIVPGSQRSPSRVIYLHKGPIELLGGDDDASKNRSSIVERGDAERVVMPGFSGSHSQWSSIVKCTRKMFAPFDVTVTDALPASKGYILVAVGGKSTALKQKQHNHAGGLAPFIPNAAIPGAVVFAFSSVSKNKPRIVCETIGMEVGHAYGLDHGYNCKDTMTYLKRCGSRTFTDKDAPCGEHSARVCAGGDPTQNSRRYLMDLLGPSK